MKRLSKPTDPMTQLHRSSEHEEHTFIFDIFLIVGATLALCPAHPTRFDSLLRRLDQLDRDKATSNSLRKCLPEDRISLFYHRKLTTFLKAAKHRLRLKKRCFKVTHFKSLRRKAIKSGFHSSVPGSHQRQLKPHTRLR